MTAQFDLTIVGAGIVGANVACLAKSRYPNIKTLLVDQSPSISRNSVYSAGLDIPVKRGFVDDGFLHETRKVYQRYHDELSASGLQQVETYWVLNEKHKNFLSKVLAVELCQASKSQVQQLSDLLGRAIMEDELVYYQVGNHVCNVANLNQRLLAHYAEQPAATLTRSCEITDYRERNGLIEVDSSSGETLTTNTLVTATGPWLTNQTEKILQKKIISFEVDNPHKVQLPIIFFAETGDFIAPQANRPDKVSCSITSKEFGPFADFTQLKASADEIKQAKQFLREQAPAFYQDALAEKVFCDAYSADRVPVLTSQFNNRHVDVTACSGAGFRLAPGLALKAIERLNLERYA